MELNQNEQNEKRTIQKIKKDMVMRNLNYLKCKVVSLIWPEINKKFFFK